MANYLEIYSTYRDRNIWPNPAEFEVLVSVSGRKSAVNAVDPVTLASPVNAWSSYFFDMNNPGNSVKGVVTSNVSLPNGERLITFISQSGSLQQSLDYYAKAVLKMDISGEESRVNSYEYLGDDKGQLIVNSPISMLIGDSFHILDPTSFADMSNPLIFTPRGSMNVDSYVGFLMYNESLNQYRPIISYNDVTGICTLNTTVPINSWLPTDNYSLRKQPPVFVDTAGLGSTNNRVVLSNGSNQNDIYVGWFLRIPQSKYGLPVVKPQGEQRRIVSYDGTTKTALVSPPYSLTTAGAVMEVQQFSYDNLYPFPYRATLQQEIPTYSIRLNRLIIPNKVLRVAGGGKPSRQNYVYVELSGIDNPNVNSMFSNNPNATRAIFTCCIPNITNLERSDYVILEGDGMLQTIRFRLDTNFKFRVSMPNGETFETVEQDTKSPTEPDTKLQIRALFQLEQMHFT